MSQQFIYNRPFRALQAGDFEEFKRMHQAGLTKLDDEFKWCWGEHLFSHANPSGGSHLDCLKYIVENIIEESNEENDYECFHWDDSVTYWAAANGSLDCLQYVKEKGFEWDEDTTGGAARCGSLKCLQFAHENGCELSPSITSNAAMSGSLECLTYVINNGSVWEQETTFWAAVQGHLNILKFAHDNRYYWHPETIQATVENLGSVECFEFCFEICTDKENFWKDEYNRIIEKLDFSKPVWRPLFLIDLNNNSKINAAVKESKKYISTIKFISKNSFALKLNDNIINYIINNYY